MRQRIVGNGPFVLVDDSALDGDFVERCLDRLPLNRDFLFLQSGEDLLDYLEGVRAARNPMPCVILLDVSMPTMSGLEVLSTIRQTPEFKDKPPINLFSGAELPAAEHEAERLDAGYIVKPLTADALSDILVSLA